MSVPDLINGSYESLGVLFILINIRAIRRDKSVRGFSLVPLAFWTSWGAWNLYYYPHLHQVASFIGAGLTFAGNAVYLSYCFKYRKSSG